MWLRLPPLSLAMCAVRSADARNCRHKSEALAAAVLVVALFCLVPSVFCAGYRELTR